jgi:hypothetical protein
MSRFANAFGPHRPEATYVTHGFPEHTFDTGEVSMNYAVAGTPDKPALLMAMQRPSPRNGAHHGQSVSLPQMFPPRSSSAGLIDCTSSAPAFRVMTQPR